MTKWEYCEVINRAGKVSILHLTDQVGGWERTGAFGSGHTNNMCVALAQLGDELAPERNGRNMAETLAQLGLEGWEVVTISLIGGSIYAPYTSTDAESRAFLKRRIPD